MTHTGHSALTFAVMHNRYLARHVFERVGSAAFKSKPRTRHQVTYRSRNENFTWAGNARNMGPDSASRDIPQTCIAVLPYFGT